MRLLFGLFELIFLLAFFITGGIWVMARVFSGMGWGLSDKATDNLLKRLREVLKPSRARLIPWEPDTLQLLSTNCIEYKRQGLFGRPETGIFTTIYQEPVLAYAEQRVGKFSLLLAQTADREFVFRRKERETEIWVNGKALGTYTQGTLSAPGKKGEVLAQIELEKDAGQFPVQIRNKTAGAVQNPARSASPNPRAVTTLREPGVEEEQVLLALALLQMKTSVSKK